MNYTPASAKGFLLSKIVAEAAHDGVTLDDVEKRMFLLSESSRAADLEANETFEKSYDTDHYEAKITRLLRNAYGRDKREKGTKEHWTAALDALRREDFYGLVMVDEAGIPRSEGGEWRVYLEDLPFAIVELVILILGFLVVFRPELLHLNLPDWVRWLGYPLVAWLAWYVGRAWQKMQTSKATKRRGQSSESDY